VGAEAPVARLDVPSLRAEPWYADRVGLGLTGIGVLGTGAGIWLLLDAGSLYDQANREDVDVERRDLRARADSRQTWGTVATAVGAAGLVAGIVKLIITPDAPSSVPMERGVSLWLAPAGLGVQGRW
jgi:hypothetical protein